MEEDRNYGCGHRPANKRTSEFGCRDRRKRRTKKSYNRHFRAYGPASKCYAPQFPGRFGGNSRKYDYFCDAKNNKMIRGVLFDMDGVLVNNTRAHVRAFEIFCKRYGVEDWQHKLQTAFGMGNDDIMRLILPEEIIREKGLKALGEEKEAIYREVYAPEIRPVRGLVELLEELRRRGIRCAVGSSGCRENVDFVLGNCGIADYFSCIVSGDRVTRCKPDPEIYLLAAEGLHLQPRPNASYSRMPGSASLLPAGPEQAASWPWQRLYSRHTLATQTEADVVIDDFASITDLNTLLL